MATEGGRRGWWCVGGRPDLLTGFKGGGGPPAQEHGSSRELRQTTKGVSLGPQEEGSPARILMSAPWGSRRCLT